MSNEEFAVAFAYPGKAGRDALARAESLDEAVTADAAEDAAIWRRVRGQDWRDTRPADFDREAKPQPLALFPEPDHAGTPDLFTADPCRTEGCPGDPDDGDGWDGFCGTCADRRDR